MNFIKGITVITVFMTLIGCSGSGDGDGGNQPADNFDRQAMLEHWADNIIIPSLEDLELELTALVAAKNDFVTDPGEATLIALRAQWLEAYKTWQYVEMFNIGQAETMLYSFQMNIYPVTVADIESNIASGTYDLRSVNNNDAVGFPAMDYLLHGLGANDAEILARYTTAEAAEGTKKYLSDVTEEMLALTGEVLDDWKSGYRDAFVANLSNNATGSVNKLTNDFIYFYEKGLRANKFGIPAGVFSATPFPDKVEAYYSSAVSKALALNALNAVQDFFNGRSYGTSGTGSSFTAYLDYLRELQGGDDLSAAINQQLNTAREQIQALDDNFSQQIETDNTMMTKAYDELQKAVVLLKVDMVQRLNITIDYVDADGD